MIKSIHNVCKLIIILLCLSLIGCGNPDQVTIHVIDSSQDSKENLENSTSFFDSSDITTDFNDDIPDTNTGTNADTNGDIDDEINRSIDDDINDNIDEDIDDNKNDDGIDDVEALIKIIFEETSETVYATTNVKIRGTYTTEADNIISILQKGDYIERIGINEEWSKVLYQEAECYIKTEYLDSEKPAADEVVVEKEDISEVTIADTPDVIQSDNTEAPSADSISVSDLKISSEINQLICVIGNGGSDCTVSYHIKADGNWQQVFNIDGDCGTEGITYNKGEGDKKTPAGLYIFTLAFGILKDPGSKLPYRQITEYDYWVDDMNSPYYNKWVNSQENPGEYNSEHLIDHNPSYNYALNINYNPDCTPGLGSAMFLHCYNGTGGTTGCIAISEEYMDTLLQSVDRTTVILIVPSSAELANY